MTFGTGQLPRGTRQLPSARTAARRPCVDDNVDRPDVHRLGAGVGAASARGERSFAGRRSSREMDSRASLGAHYVGAARGQSARNLHAAAAKRRRSHSVRAQSGSIVVRVWATRPADPFRRGAERRAGLTFFPRRHRSLGDCDALRGTVIELSGRNRAPRTARRPAPAAHLATRQNSCDAKSPLARTCVRVRRLCRVPS
jgi:hypothetical protein